MSSNSILEIKNLTKHFPVRGNRHKVVHAVDNVSFAIKKGKTLGLVGESGCGKSSCARVIIRVYDPTSGQIFLNSRNITKMKENELKPLRRDIQMIFQDLYSSLNPRMTVHDLIAEPLNAHLPSLGKNDKDELILEMLEKVGLSREHTGRYAHEFSGGQRQRVGIARALILKPQIVICDEPISALDVSIQAQIVNLLKDFQQELGLTYLFIAHDLSMVRYFSDDIGVMYLGQVVEICGAAEIYHHPLHPYTVGLLSSVPIPNPKLARLKKDSSIEGDLPSPIDPPAGCRFHTRCKQVMPVCSQIQPEMKEVSTSHFTACHLYY